MTIYEWIQHATTQLVGVGIATAKLDTEIILAHTLKKPRTWLHAHGDEVLNARQLEIAGARLDLRLDRVPVAYIIGHKEFYGRPFKVTTATLIPRPESEAIIELLTNVLRQGRTSTQRLVDVGTGSGALGITAKLEHPCLDVTLIDIDRHALRVAEKNANTLGAQVAVLQSDLLASYPFKATIVVANLPYVDPEWERSPETVHEPTLALFAGDHGLELIKELIDQLPHKLTPDGYVLLEADPRQHHMLTHYASGCGLRSVATKGFAIAYQLAEPDV